VIAKVYGPILGMGTVMGLSVARPRHFEDHPTTYRDDKAKAYFSKLAISR
jgi:hypothetical protein